MAKPSSTLRSFHVSMTISDRQIARVKSGALESRPGDYQTPSEAARRQGIARRLIEDRQVARELGLDPYHA